MSIVMELKKSFNPALRFPTKASMKPVLQRPSVNIVSNHFKVQLEDNYSVFTQWTISLILHGQAGQTEVSEVEDGARRLIEEVILANKSELKASLGKYFVTGLTLYATSAGKAERFVFKNHPARVLVVERKTDPLKVSDIMNGGNQRFELLRFLNSMVKDAMCQMQFRELGMNKQYFRKDQMINVSSGTYTFQLMQGYKTAFEVYEGGLRLLINRSTRIIRQKSIWEEYLEAQSQGKAEAYLEENVIGRSVITKYGNNRIYRIDKVLFDARITDPFPSDAYANYKQYFHAIHHENLKFPNQFMLLHERKRRSDGEGKENRVERVILPAELVQATGLTDEMRSNRNVMRDLAKHTSLPPSDNFKWVNGLVNDINKKKTGFGFNIMSGKNDLKGTQLQAPQLMIGKTSVQAPANGIIRVTEPVDSRPLKDWAIVFDKKHSTMLNDIIEALKKASKGHRIDFYKPDICYELTSRLQPSDILSKLMSNMTKSPVIVLFVVSKFTAAWLYASAKRYFGQQGIRTQFLVSFNPERDLSQLSKFSKLTLQMVSKMGGGLWLIKRQIKDTLILGADVFHCRGRRSVASVVSMFDVNMSRSYSTVRMQSREYEEVMKNLSNMVLEHVENYVKLTKKPPQQLIFYRDGVGEGMLERILSEEVRALVDALGQRYKTDQPKLLFVVVTKRIDDRFVGSNSSGFQNPEGGLLVANDVVKPDSANFFLIAQRVTQGTANPTHYEVVYSESQMSFDDLTQLTYDLTWAYSNWQGPVKIPAPVQYAHKLCALVGITQEAKVNVSLQRSYYYL